MRAIPLGLPLALLALTSPVSHAQTPTPQWNPFTLVCENAPQVVDPVAAQCNGLCFGFSAPRVSGGPVRPGEAVEVGLWDRSLAPNDGRATARVTSPDGTTSTTTREGYGTGWISLRYPNDFSGAGSTVPGPYTIVWETRGLTLCDGFRVESGA